MLFSYKLKGRDSKSDIYIFSHCLPFEAIFNSNISVISQNLELQAFTSKYTTDRSKHRKKILCIKKDSFTFQIIKSLILRKRNHIHKNLNSPDNIPIKMDQRLNV